MPLPCAGKATLHQAQRLQQVRGLVGWGSGRCAGAPPSKSLSAMHSCPLACCTGPHNHLRACLRHPQPCQPSSIPPSPPAVACTATTTRGAARPPTPPTPRTATPRCPAAPATAATPSATSEQGWAAGADFCAADIGAWCRVMPQGAPTICSVLFCPYPPLPIPSQPSAPGALWRPARLTPPALVVR